VSLILDSSATLAWVYSDETTEALRQVFDAVTENGAWVPGLWRLEVRQHLRNGGEKRPHRRRVSGVQGRNRESFTLRNKFFGHRNLQSRYPTSNIGDSACCGVQRGRTRGLERRPEGGIALLNAIK
jgi:hypothetical protein